MHVKSLALFATAALATCPSPSDIREAFVEVDVYTYFQDGGKGLAPIVNATGKTGDDLPATALVTLSPKHGFSPTLA